MTRGCRSCPLESPGLASGSEAAEGNASFVLSMAERGVGQEDRELRSRSVPILPQHADLRAGVAGLGAERPVAVEPVVDGTGKGVVAALAAQVAALA